LLKHFILKNFIAILDLIIEELKNSSADLDRMNIKDVALLKEATDQIPYILWVHDYKGMKPLFINKKAKEYYGYTDEYINQEGFEVYTNLCHPDYYIAIHNAVAFWVETPRDYQIETYKAKTKDRSWRWTISVAKAFKFSKTNEVENIITLVFDMDDVLNESIISSNKYSGFVTRNQEAYNHLTEREIEILKLIGQGNSSKQIANSIKISVSTVETHRNNLRQKLNAKNSHELVKFAILFHPEII
jgi:DNA-binding CsgD family transcriptional regulator